MSHDNNAILESVRAMPMKDLTSTNESFFSMKRNLFTRTASTAQSNEVYLRKKHYGVSNRDASTRTREKLKNTIGLGLNLQSDKISFTNNQTTNIVQNQALQRMRNKGYVVPLHISNADF